MKRVSVSEGFVCVNDEFDTCSDFEVQWCCPKWGASANGDDHCVLKGYEWTPWMNEDSPVTGTGDWETIQSQSELKVCSNPTAIQAFPATAGATANTHIDVEIGFWCLNEENSADCADFEVRWCCPTYEDFECDDEGYEWTQWLDRDDPIGEGDYETRFSYPQGSVCEDPTAIQAQARTAGSTAFTHVDLAYGFWCDNSEQPNGAQCADFEVRYCCPKMKEVACDAEGYGWTVWLDRDDPIESGDWENKDGFPAYIVCKDPLAVEAAVVTGSGGSTMSSPRTRFAPISKSDSAAQLSTPTHARSPRLLSPPTLTSSTTQAPSLAIASATTVTPETGPLAHQLTLRGHAKTTSRLASRCSPPTPMPTLRLTAKL